MVRGEPQLVDLVVVELYRLDQPLLRADPEAMHLMAQVKDLEGQTQGSLRVMAVQVVVQGDTTMAVVVALHSQEAPVVVVEVVFLFLLLPVVVMAGVFRAQ
jgi:hypothetical protein